MPKFSLLRRALDDCDPWLAPYRSRLLRLLEDVEVRCVADALNAQMHERIDVRFGAQSEMPETESYEAFIARTSLVPTRDNLHDLFNGLMWLAHPRTKRRLNQLQSQQIAAHGIGASRGALRDALTLFDENSAILQAPADLIDALRRRDWQQLFVRKRASWQGASLVVFGHALMEKLMQPRKAITAHVWVVDEIHDAAIAASLTPERLIAKAFLPLPILGVPGWWPDNEIPAFYDDAEVFRPRR